MATILQGPDPQHSLEQEMKRRTTAWVITELGRDVQRCHGELIAAIDAGRPNPDGTISADYEYHARQLIRAIFASIEAVTFSMKIKAASVCMARSKTQLSPAERYFAAEVEHSLSDKGIVAERRAHIRFADNLRFAFTLLERAHRSTQRFDPSVAWWSCLKESIKVRDRLMHPKIASDIEISGDEIVTALKAYDGFTEHALSYPAFRVKRRSIKRNSSKKRTAKQ
jgi:hypothetical protein